MSKKYVTSQTHNPQDSQIGLSGHTQQTVPPVPRHNSLSIYIWTFRNEKRNYCSYVQIGDSIEIIRYKIVQKLKKNDTFVRVICPYATDPTDFNDYTRFWITRTDGSEHEYICLEDLVNNEDPTFIRPLFDGIIFSAHDE